MTAQMISTIELLAHQIATIHNDLSRAWTALTQELTQEALANVQQQGHLLGIDSSAQNRSDSGFSPQETPVMSGGRTTAPVPSAKSPMNLMSPNGGSGQPAVWKPVANGDYLWSDPANWSTDEVPENGIPATFDGSYNSKCIVDVSTTEGSITLQNGFTAPFELEAALNIPDYVDNNIGADDFNVQFLADVPMNLDAEVQAPDQVVDTPGNFDWGPGGVINVENGVTYNLGVRANLAQSSAVPIVVGAYGRLNFGDSKNSGQYSTFQLTNAAANISVNQDGGIRFYQTGAGLISRANAGPVISNNGFVWLIGVAGAGLTDIAVPLQNHSSFNVNGGTFEFGVADANGNDLSMDAGSINLSGGATVKCGDQYTQTGG
jgi:hypothetical protein